MNHNTQDKTRLVAPLLGGFGLQGTAVGGGSPQVSLSSSQTPSVGVSSQAPANGIPTSAEITFMKIGTRSLDRVREGISLSSSGQNMTSFTNYDQLVPVMVKNCPHHNRKVKKKYLLINSWKKCAICRKRWCGAKCTDCGKPLHQECTDERDDVICTTIQHMGDSTSEIAHCHSSPHNYDTTFESNNNHQNNSSIIYNRPNYQLCDILFDVQYKVHTHVVDFYDQNDKTLNLSEFFTHHGFSYTDGFTSLMMAKIIDKALSVIYDCIGDELCGLRLAKNKITSCDGLRCLPALFPNLKILDLSDNDINDLTTFESFAGLPIEWLYVYGNPIDETTERTHFTLSVQNLFPHLRFLNTVELEPLEGYSSIPTYELCQTNASKKRKLSDYED